MTAAADPHTSQYRRSPSPAAPPPPHQLRRQAAVLLRRVRWSGRRSCRRNRKGGLSIKEEVEEEEREGEVSDDFGVVESREELLFGGTPMQVLPGEEASFWAGEQWDGFGFFAVAFWHHLRGVICLNFDDSRSPHSM